MSIVGIQFVEMPKKGEKALVSMECSGTVVGPLALEAERESCFRKGKG
jgi:hypothetical protein